MEQKNIYHKQFIILRVYSIKSDIRRIMIISIHCLMDSMGYMKYWRGTTMMNNNIQLQQDNNKNNNDKNNNTFDIDSMIYQ